MGVIGEGVKEGGTGRRQGKLVCRAVDACRAGNPPPPLHPLLDQGVYSLCHSRPYLRDGGSRSNVSDTPSASVSLILIDPCTSLAMRPDS